MARLDCAHSWPHARVLFEEISGVEREMDRFCKPWISKNFPPARGRRASMGFSARKSGSSDVEACIYLGRHPGCLSYISGDRGFRVVARATGN